MRGVATGKMRHRIAIHAPTLMHSTTTGEGSESFLPTGVVRWCSIEQITGDEAFDAAQVAAGATHKITMRYCKILTDRHQFVFGKREFAIKSIWIPEEVKDFQVVYVSEL